MNFNRVSFNEKCRRCTSNLKLDVSTDKSDSGYRCDLGDPLTPLPLSFLLASPANSSTGLIELLLESLISNIHIS